MKTTKTVKTSVSNSRNMEVLFGISNKQVSLKFNENCEANVEDDDLEELVATHDQLSEVEKTKEDLSFDLELLEIEELRSMAKEAKLNKKDWEKLSKEDLVVYLNKKQ